MFIKDLVSTMALLLQSKFVEVMTETVQFLKVLPSYLPLIPSLLPPSPSVPPSPRFAKKKKQREQKQKSKENIKIATNGLQWSGRRELYLHPLLRPPPPSPDPSWSLLVPSPLPFPFPLSPVLTSNSGDNEHGGRRRHEAYPADDGWWLCVHDAGSQGQVQGLWRSRRCQAHQTIWVRARGEERRGEERRVVEGRGEGWRGEKRGRRRAGEGEERRGEEKRRVGRRMNVCNRYENLVPMFPEDCHKVLRAINKRERQKKDKTKKEKECIYFLFSCFFFSSFPLFLFLSFSYLFFSFLFFLFIYLWCKLADEGSSDESDSEFLGENLLGNKVFEKQVFHHPPSCFGYFCFVFSFVIYLLVLNLFVEWTRDIYYRRWRTYWLLGQESNEACYLYEPTHPSKAFSSLLFTLITLFLAFSFCIFYFESYYFIQRPSHRLNNSNNRRRKVNSKCCQMAGCSSKTPTTMRNLTVSPLYSLHPSFHPSFHLSLHLFVIYITFTSLRYLFQQYNGEVADRW